MWKKHYFRMRNGFGLDTDIINELISRGCETVELRFSDVKRSYTTSPENLLLYGDDWKFDGNAQKIMRVDRWVEGALPRARRKRATA
jgi:hypothetical protein